MNKVLLAQRDVHIHVLFIAVLGLLLLLLLSCFSHVWLCIPRDGSLPGSSVPGILQARTLNWVAISFSNAWKWKVKVKSLSRVRLLATPWTAAHQAPLSMGFSRQELLEWGAIAFSTFGAIRSQLSSWDKAETKNIYCLALNRKFAVTWIMGYAYRIQSQSLVFKVV